MAGKSLFLKYRPRVWNDVVEQDAIKQILNYELSTNQLKRVLLFTGPAGCGKTTSARIFANEIESNKSNIIEINCADHTGVDDVRSLIIDASKTKPLSGKYKIFILDECHQFTVQSQNALLKILEEPPKHCVYILCTTDPQKVLSTILSRTFRYDFQLISHKGIMDRLNYILNTELNSPDGCGIQTWEQNAIDLIATSSGGHMRDAINLLDKSISYSKYLTIDVVTKVLGVTNYDILFTILDSILNKDETQLLSGLDNLSKSGIDLKLFVKNFLSFVLDVNKYVILKKEPNISEIMDYIKIPKTFTQKMLSYNMSHGQMLKKLLTTLISLNSSLKWETNVRPVLESCLLLEII